LAWFMYRQVEGQQDEAIIEAIHLDVRDASDQIPFCLIIISSLNELPTEEQDNMQVPSGRKGEVLSPRGANAASATTALTGVLHGFRYSRHLKSQDTLVEVLEV